MLEPVVSLASGNIMLVVYKNCVIMCLRGLCCVIFIFSILYLAKGYLVRYHKYNGLACNPITQLKFVYSIFVIISYIYI